MSFALTKDTFNNRTKTVTRRLGWSFLRPGDRLMGVEKAQGIKKGELMRLHEIEVVSVHRETLTMFETYGKMESQREGFPYMQPQDFVRMFCQHMNCTPDRMVTRIEFKHL